MTNKYYKITSPKFIEVAEFYEKQCELFNDVVGKMAEEFGIEANQYYIELREYTIVPTDNDCEKFRAMLKKGTGTFKQNSIVSKRFKQLLAEYEITNVSKPMLWDFLNVHSYKMRSSYHKIDGVYYGHCGIENGAMKDTEGFEEIKASEFHKLIEDYNEKILSKQKEAKND